MNEKDNGEENNTSSRMMVIIVPGSAVLLRRELSELVSCATVELPSVDLFQR
jgi:hypothetical protein